MSALQVVEDLCDVYITINPVERLDVSLVNLSFDILQISGMNEDVNINIERLNECLNTSNSMFASVLNRRNYAGLNVKFKIRHMYPDRSSMLSNKLRNAPGDKAAACLDELLSVLLFSSGKCTMCCPYEKIRKVHMFLGLDTSTIFQRLYQALNQLLTIMCQSSSLQTVSILKIKEH